MLNSSKIKPFNKKKKLDFQEVNRSIDLDDFINLLNLLINLNKNILTKIDEKTETNKSFSSSYESEENSLDKNTENEVLDKTKNKNELIDTKVNFRTNLKNNLNKKLFKIIPNKNVLNKNSNKNILNLSKSKFKENLNINQSNINFNNNQSEINLNSNQSNINVNKKISDNFFKNNESVNIKTVSDNIQSNNFLNENTYSFKKNVSKNNFNNNLNTEDKNIFNDLNIDNFLENLINLVNNPVGIHNAEIPFNCHPEIIKKYLIEVFKINENVFKKKNNKTPLMLKFIIVSASFLPTIDENLNYDPYFEVYSPNKKLVNCPYKSKFFKSNSNPVWNEKFYVPVSREDLNSKKKIKIELWDKDPATLIEAFYDLKNIKSFKSFYKISKDFLEVVFSFLIKIKVDDKIGECYIKFNEIPGTGTKLIKKIQDTNSNEKGIIKMQLDWGYLNIKTKKEKLSAILNHMNLYFHCLNYHINKLIEKKSLEEFKFEKINFLRLFYISELTLINQNRIKYCLTQFEDCIIRRSVLIKFLLIIPNDKIKLRTLILSMIVNEDLSYLPEIMFWNDISYKEVLKNFEITNLNNLVQFYLPKFNIINDINIKNEYNFDMLELLQFLRCINKYDKFYKDAKLIDFVSLKLKNFLIKLIENLLIDFNKWNFLLNKLDFLNENFEKYWQQNLKNIFTNYGYDNLKEIYESYVYKIIQYKLNEWTKLNEIHYNSDKLIETGNLLISWYFFCKNFEFIIFDYIQKIDSTSNIIEIDFNQNDDSNEELLIDNKDNFLIKETKINNNEQNNLQLNINNLNFSDLVKSKIVNNNLKKIFPKHLFNDWMNDRVNYCLKLINSIVDQELRIIVNIVENSLLKKKLIKNNYSSFEIFFYETLTETIYFFNSLDYWDEKFYENTIDKFCQCMYIYLKSFKELLMMNCNKINNQEKVDLVLIYSINELFKLESHLLNKILIQIIFDHPFDVVWACVNDFIKTKKINLNDIIDTKKMNSKDKINSEKINLNNQKNLKINLKDKKYLNDQVNNKKIYSTNKLNDTKINSNELIEESINDKFVNSRKNFKIDNKKNKFKELVYTENSVKSSDTDNVDFNELFDTKKINSNELINNKLNNLNSDAKLIFKTCLKILKLINQVKETVNELIIYVSKKIIINFQYQLIDFLDDEEIKIDLANKILNNFDNNVSKITYKLINQQDVLNLIIFLKHNLDLNLKNIILRLKDLFFIERKKKLTSIHLTKIKFIKTIIIYEKIKDFFILKSKNLIDNLDEFIFENNFNFFFIDSQEFEEIKKKIFQKV